MKNIKRNTILCMFSLFILLSLTGCGNKKENLLNEKINSQIDYIDKYIVSMLNSFNNISYTNYKMEIKDENSFPVSKISQSESNKNNQGNTDNKLQTPDNQNTPDANLQDKNTDSNTSSIIMTPNSILLNKKEKTDWDSLKFEIENIYSTWNTLFIDLNSNGIGNKETLEFSNILNNVTNDIKNENRSESLNNLSKLYSELVKYAKNSTDDNLRINLLETKSYILSTYTNVSNENWKDAKTNINLASEKYSNIINNIAKKENKQSSINKSYVYIKEAEKAIDIKDTDIFYIYYKLLMQELNNI